MRDSFQLSIARWRERAGCSVRARSPLDCNLAANRSSWIETVTAARLRRTCAYGYIRDNVPAAAIKTLLFSLGYVFLLIAGLVIVNIVLARLTREEREAERQRRRQRKTS